MRECEKLIKMNGQRLAKNSRKKWVRVMNKSTFSLISEVVYPVIRYNPRSQFALIINDDEENETVKT